MSTFFGRFVDGRRGQILDAALDVFGSKGYEAGTMREIAAIVGVSEPALYRHYAGKEALLIDLMETASVRMVDTARERLATIGIADIPGALSMIVRDRRDQMTSNAALMRTMMVTAHHNAPAAEAFRRSVSGPMIEVLRDLVERIDASRSIVRDAGETDALVHAMMSLMVGHLMTSQFLEVTSDEGIVAVIMKLMGWQEA